MAAFLTMTVTYVFQHCKVDSGSFTKDLSFVHKDLSSIIILDNSPGAYKGFPGKWNFASKGTG